MPAGVHGLAGSTPTSRPKGLETLVQHLSPALKACGECRRNYMTLDVPGSNPGRVPTGAIAQAGRAPEKTFLQLIVAAGLADQLVTFLNG